MFSILPSRDWDHRNGASHWIQYLEVARKLQIFPNDADRETRVEDPMDQDVPHVS